MELGGLLWTNVLSSALPPQRHRPDTQSEHQDPVSHRAQKKMEKKERKRERGREGGRKRKEKRSKEGRKEEIVIEIKNNY